MEGFERGRNLEKIGQHAQDTAELSFADVRVPAENLLGEEGQGFLYLVSNLPQERLSIAASAVAAAEAALWLDARVRARAPAPSASRSAPSRTRASPSPSCAAKSRSARVYIDRCAQALDAGRADAGGRRDGEVVVHRAAGPRGGPLPAAARRLRLHARVPDRPRLRGRPRDAHIRRRERDHEGDRRAARWGL